ncbi:hypothetical protein BC835DRAFT_1100220 [Cytidiella melzeri]|nr:hypothetical protein BC835DRAFT_1100220 [Cytidiella melzeri]
MSPITQHDIILTLIEVISQTLVYGIFVAVLPISISALARRRGTSAEGPQGQRRPSDIILWLTLAAFILSTAYWAVCVALLVAKITDENVNPLSAARVMFNSVMLINCIFADGVVVWRMYAVCGEHFSRGILLLPPALLCVTATFITATIVLRIVIIVVAFPGNQILHGPLITSFDIFQTSAIAFSLITNLAATTVVAIWARRNYRAFAKTMSSAYRASTSAERILVILAESGIVYCVSSAVLLMGQIIHTPVGGTIGDIYSPIQVQLAGIYPSLVMILVSKQRTEDTATFNKSNGPTGSLRFGDPLSSRHSGVLRTTVGEDYASRLDDFVIATEIPGAELNMKDYCFV